MGVSVVNLLLSIALVQKYGIIGVALGAVIPQILFHGFYVPWSTLKIIELSVKEYFVKTYMPSIVPSIVLFIALYFVSVYFYPDSFLKLLSSAFVCTLIYMLFVYMLMLDKNEKATSIKYLRKVLRLPA